MIDSHLVFLVEPSLYKILRYSFMVLLQKEERHLPLDRMIRKAYDLIRKKRVERLGDGLYNVIGEHGTYAVARRIDGTVTCTCPGFANKGRCSHSLAVLLLNDPSLLKSVEREIMKSSDRGASRDAQR